jgi:CRISPR-associated endoribonuclease Cas6
MLVSIVLILRPSGDCFLPATVGNAVYASFLKIVGQRDEALAHRLHAPGPDKPFTVSPLQGAFQPINDRLSLQKDQEYWLRFTSLNPELSRLLLDLDARLVKTVKLFDADFEVVRIAKQKGEHPWADRTTFEVLYNSWVASSQQAPMGVTMAFFSPTTFWSNQRNVPLPLPKLVFLTLAEKWNVHSPIHLGLDIAHVIDEQMSISRYDLRTQMLNFGQYRQIGFVGNCQFLLHRRTDEILAKVVNLLADFAFYAGVGRKTTMGMGQVRRLKENKVR